MTLVMIMIVIMIMIMILPGDPFIPLSGVLTGKVARGVAAVVGDRKPIILKIKIISPH